MRRSVSPYLAKQSSTKRGIGEGIGSAWGDWAGISSKPSSSQLTDSPAPPLGPPLASSPPSLLSSKQQPTFRARRYSSLSDPGDEDAEAALLASSICAGASNSSSNLRNTVITRTTSATSRSVSSSGGGLVPHSHSSTTGTGLPPQQPRRPGTAGTTRTIASRAVSTAGSREPSTSPSSARMPSPSSGRGRGSSFPNLCASGAPMTPTTPSTPLSSKTPTTVITLHPSSTPSGPGGEPSAAFDTAESESSNAALAALQEKFAVLQRRNKVLEKHAKTSDLLSESNGKNHITSTITALPTPPASVPLTHTPLQPEVSPPKKAATATVPGKMEQRVRQLESQLRESHTRIQEVSLQNTQLLAAAQEHQQQQQLQQQPQQGYTRNPPVPSLLDRSSEPRKSNDSCASSNTSSSSQTTSSSSISCSTASLSRRGSSVDGSLADGLPTPTTSILTLLSLPCPVSPSLLDVSSPPLSQQTPVVSPTTPNIGPKTQATHSTHSVATTPSTTAILATAPPDFTSKLQHMLQPLNGGSSNHASHQQVKEPPPEQPQSPTSHLSHALLSISSPFSSSSGSTAGTCGGEEPDCPPSQQPHITTTITHHTTHTLPSTAAEPLPESKSSDSVGSGSALQQHFAPPAAVAPHRGPASMHAHFLDGLLLHSTLSNLVTPPEQHPYNPSNPRAGPAKVRPQSAAASTTSSHTQRCAQTVITPEWAILPTPQAKRLHPSAAATTPPVIVTTACVGVQTDVFPQLQLSTLGSGHLVPLLHAGGLLHNGGITSSGSSASGSSSTAQSSDSAPVASIASPGSLLVISPVIQPRCTSPLSRSHVDKQGHAPRSAEGEEPSAAAKAAPASARDSPAAGAAAATPAAAAAAAATAACGSEDTAATLALLVQECGGGSSGEVVLSDVAWRVQQQGVERALRVQLQQARAAFQFIKGEYNELEVQVKEVEAQRREYAARYAFLVLDQDCDGYIRTEQVQVFDMFTPYSPAVLDYCFRHWRYTSGFQGYLTIEDFLRFVAIADDRSSTDSLRFWFSVMDLDGDGFFSPADLKWFYECVAKGDGFVVSFEDLWYQLVDMVKPQQPRLGLTCAELRKCKLGPGVVGLVTNHNNMLLQRTTAEWGRTIAPLLVG